MLSVMTCQLYGIRSCTVLTTSAFNSSGGSSGPSPGLLRAEWVGNFSGLAENTRSLRSTLILPCLEGELYLLIR